jgi:CLIP-associating protein 1/2
MLLQVTLVCFVAVILNVRLLSVPQYNVAEILGLCSSGHWVDRKEGLVGLQALLRSQRQLSASELRKVTDSFTKMFTDPHTKARTRTSRPLFFSLAMSSNIFSLIFRVKEDLGVSNIS